MRIVLPNGEIRGVDVKLDASAGDVTTVLGVSGFVIVAEDGQLIYPADNLYAAVQDGQVLNMTAAETGGKGGVGVPSGVDDPDFWKVVARYQLIYSFAGLAVGVAFAIAGMTLFFHGVTGSTGWIAEAFGAKSSLTDAPPGVILFVAGFLIIVATGFRVKANSR